MKLTPPAEAAACTPSAVGAGGFHAGAGPFLEETRTAAPLFGDA